MDARLRKRSDLRGLPARQGDRQELRAAGDHGANQRRRIWYAMPNGVDRQRFLRMIMVPFASVRIRPCSSTHQALFQGQ